MRVHVVSDVHGRTDALRAAADGADALLCLGDMLLFIDYADNAQGIFPDLFGAEATQRFVALRTAKRFDEARDMARRLWDGLGGDPSGHVEIAASRQYAELFAALPEPAYLTYGNVDIPRMWRGDMRPGPPPPGGGRAQNGRRGIRLPRARGATVAVSQGRAGAGAGQRRAPRAHPGQPAAFPLFRPRAPAARAPSPNR